MLSPSFVPRVLALALSSVCLGACSQIELTQLYFANNGTEAKLDRALPVTLPFRDAEGWIVVPASINGSEPVDFVLDTGASMLALLTGPKTEALRLDMSDAHRLGAEGDLAAPFGAPQENLDIDFGPISLLQQTALAIPLDTVLCRSDIPPPPFTGVIGHELFHRYVVEVNYDRREVVLHDPETYDYRGQGEIVAVDISGRQPFAQVQVQPPQGAAYAARLHVDSGAGIDLSLFPGTHPSIVVPEQGKRDSACFVGGLAEYHSGTSVDLGFGATSAKEIPAQYAIGREVIDTGQNGRLGAKFLRRYNVIFDYSRERMILEPRNAAVARLD
jgi:hypothetical protein